MPGSMVTTSTAGAAGTVASMRTCTASAPDVTNGSVPVVAAARSYSSVPASGPSSVASRGNHAVHAPCSRTRMVMPSGAVTDGSQVRPTTEKSSVSITPVCSSPSPPDASSGAGSP